MVNNYILFLLNVCILISSISTQCTLNIEGWYWRDFSGSIPDDAFQAGVDLNRKPIYIGKVSEFKFMIPAMIHQGDNRAYFEYGAAQSTTENILILCTKNLENFEWVKTTITNLHLLTGRHLVIGGFQSDFGATTYIGRGVVEGETAVGKIIAADHEFSGLLTVKGDRNFNFKEFEILAYNPNTNSTINY